MKYLFAVPVVATLLLGGFAMAETVATSSTDPAPASVGADAPGDQGGPDQDKWHGHHHHFGHFMHGPSPLADLPKPMTADSVKQALDAWFARRPQVKSVTEKDPNILVVEIVDPEGKSHRFELNKTTGERRPAW
jgi:hypothetical protein